MTLAPVNQVAVIPMNRSASASASVEVLAPSTMRKLVLELTPARAATLDLFEITTGLSVQALFNDWFDDEIAAVLLGKVRS